MAFLIKKKEDKSLDKAYESSMAELNAFFGIGWKRNRPSILLVSDRETINSLRQEKTQDWLVGWTKGGDIYVLDKKNYAKESSHKYSPQEYKKIIKHELVHAFHLIVSRQVCGPLWLWEGLAVYLSGQIEGRQRPKVLTRFLEFKEYRDADLYDESGFAVEFLVKKFGKKKLLNLLSSLKANASEAEFKGLFKKIYGFKLEYNGFNYGRKG